MRALIGLCMAVFRKLAPGENTQNVGKIDTLRVKASDGDIEAQAALGYTYYRGEGGPQDYVEAHKWFLLAAKQGYSVAQTNLGVMYGNGKGVPQDYVQAHKWFNLAAAQGSASTAEIRDLIAEKMSPAQLAEAQKLAREWTAAHPK